MSCLIVIPARLKSPRLPEKLLKKIRGKDYCSTAQRVKKTDLDFVIAIDDRKFIETLDYYSCHGSLLQKLIQVVPVVERLVS